MLGVYASNASSSINSRENGDFSRRRIIWRQFSASTYTGTEDYHQSASRWIKSRVSRVSHRATPPPSNATEHHRRQHHLAPAPSTAVQRYRPPPPSTFGHHVPRHRQAPAPKPPRRKLLSPASHPAFLLRYIDSAVGSESNSARSLAISF